MKRALSIAHCLTALVAVAASAAGEGFDRAEPSDIPKHDGGEGTTSSIARVTRSTDAEGWVATTSMNTARRGAGAALLPDGKVLVAGGGLDIRVLARGTLRGRAAAWVSGAAPPRA